MQSSEVWCPLCRRKGSTRRQIGLPEVLAVSCPRCGGYAAEARLLQELATTYRHRDDRRHIVSALCRQRTEQKREPLRVTEENLETLPSSAPSTVLERLDALILNLSVMVEARRSPGEVVIKLDEDYPLGFCRDEGDLAYLVGLLGQQRLLHEEAYPNAFLVRLTAAGWERIRQLQRTGQDSLQGFVAMSFADEFEPLYWEGIKPAIDGRYKAHRVKEAHPEEKIDDHIMVEIKRSRFLVADVTGNNPNVCFEAGYAIGHGIPVLWTCRQDQLDDKDLVFDVRQYACIGWTQGNWGELRQKLAERIENRIG